MSRERKIFTSLLLAPLTHSGVKQTAMSPEYEALTAGLRRDNPQTPVLYLGMASCSISAGAEDTRNAVREWLRRNQPSAELVEVGCIGLCSEEPILDVRLPGRSKLTFSKVSAPLVPELLSNLFSKTPDPARYPVLGQSREASALPWDNVPFLEDHPFFRIQTRRVLRNCGIIDPTSIDEYLARGGYKAFAKTLHTMIPSEVCEEVRDSGLRGRGGAGFSTGRKWTAALNTLSNQKYMICNADEGDPGAFMARAMIEGDPHRLLEGLAIASYAIGASKAYIYIRAEYPLAIERLKRAVEQASAYGLLGENILDSGFDLKIIVKQGAGAFVCGEETALIESMEGKRGMPRLKPPFPAQSGYLNEPSNINNVETFANVAWIINNGGAAFAAMGTENSKGTKVFALTGKVQRGGLVEVPMGNSLRDVIFDIAGGIKDGRSYKAVQMGGPSGGCIPADLVDTPIDYKALSATGAIMGSGGMVVMDDSTCMVNIARFFLDFTARESCGKCVPCRIGTTRMMEILNRICDGQGQEGDIEMLEQLCVSIKDGSLCGLGQTAPNPVLTTIRYFRDEYEAHIRDKKCPAHECSALLKISIDPTKCKGCTVCARKCPVECISGERKTPHVIDQSSCIKCKQCVSSCKFDAIVVD